MPSSLSWRRLPAAGGKLPYGLDHSGFGPEYFGRAAEPAAQRPEVYGGSDVWNTRRGEWRLISRSTL